MTNKEYVRNIERLREIEEIVKNPESSLERIESLIDETGNIVSACYGYTRGLREKVESLNNLE